MVNVRGFLRCFRGCGCAHGTAAFIFKIIRLFQLSVQHANDRAFQRCVRPTDGRWRRPK